MKKRQLMGVLNCTPDSYFAKSRCTSTEEAISYGMSLFSSGADIVDIGGESTAPHTVPVSAEEELSRVLPVIRGLRKLTDLPLSIDTYKPAVARAAIEAGVNWLNDITGLADPEMQALARSSGVACCLMHMYSPPHTHAAPHYPRGVIEEIKHFFCERTEQLLHAGIRREQIILDPGIGGGAFGKTVDHTLQIIREVHRFTHLGYPILIGLSRKSFLQKILHKSAAEVLSTTLALNTMALQGGATYLRVHDVTEHRDILTVFDAFDAVI